MNKQALIEPISAGSREDEALVFLRGGCFRYGSAPVPGTAHDSLDRRHLRDYFGRILGGSVPPANDVDHWQGLLQHLGLATPSEDRLAATVDGMLLFGKDTKRFLPQSGIRAICYLGLEPDYATRADEDLKGPMVPLCDPEDGDVVKLGLVEKAWDFVRRNTTPSAYLEGPRRIDRWEYPEEAVREAVVNALVHRDYSIAGTDIMLAIFSDRLEVISPGGLPSRVTPSAMRAGMRYARNQTLVNVMRDYGYVDARGMGIRNKIIPGMSAHNGTEPDLIVEEYRFTVRLWKESKP